MSVTEAVGVGRLRFHSALAESSSTAKRHGPEPRWRAGAQRGWKRYLWTGV